MNTALQDGQYTFLITHPSILLRNVLDKSSREHQNTHFTFDNVLP